MAQAQEGKPAKEVLSVVMTDGRTVEFAGKRKLIKTVLTEGLGGVRFDFVNGETRDYWVPQHHASYSAGHGLGQKLGDDLAGAKDDSGQPIDVDDMVLRTDTLYERLSADGSDWNVVSAGGGASSLLIKALVELKSSTVEKVKAYLQTKSDEEIKALKLLPPVKSIIARLQDERDAKRAKNVDLAGLEAELAQI